MRFYGVKIKLKNAYKHEQFLKRAGMIFIDVEWSVFNLLCIHSTPKNNNNNNNQRTVELFL